MNEKQILIDEVRGNPFFIDKQNPGIVRGGWLDEMGGFLIGRGAQFVVDALNATTVFRHEANHLNGLLIHALSACAHYQEFFDTKCEHEVDLTAAQTLLKIEHMRDWVRDNKVMLPVRRDGKSFFEALE